MSKLQNSQLAAVFYGPKDLRVERVPIRQPKADEVLLKVGESACRFCYAVSLCQQLVYCGICGSGTLLESIPIRVAHRFATDLHKYSGGGIKHSGSAPHPVLLMIIADRR